MKHFPLLLPFFLLSFSLHAQFRSGENLRLTEPYHDDIYLAGGQVSVTAPVSGDCMVTGGEITIADSIAADLTAAGGKINLRGTVGDDVRVAGGSVVIDAEVMDDLIVFGGQITIAKDAVIHGDVVSYGGELMVEGTIHGAIKASGGNITIAGAIHGPASLSSGTLAINDGAQFYSAVSYWSEDGEVDFGGSVLNGPANYDTSLAWEGNDYSDETTLLGIGMFFVIMFVIGGFLIVLLLEWAFGKWFAKAANEVVDSWAKSLGAGVLYVVGVPFLILFSFAIVVGIPIGVLVLVIYLFSMIFGNLVAALLITGYWKETKAKTWSKFLTALIAILIAVALQFLTAIPFLGFLISLVVLCITYGAIILAIRARNSRTPESDLSSTVGGLG